LAYSLEKLSEHPLAKTIVKKVEDMKIEASDVENFACLIGSGVSANVDSQTFYASKPEFFEELRVSTPNKAEIEKLRMEGKTVVLVGDSERIKGTLGIRDEIRPNAKEIISELRNRGIKVVMLTGDSEVLASAISRELSLDEFRANLKPSGKTEAIKELEQMYGNVATVGDGINDAPALAQATIGIAIGTVGSNLAIETADGALMADDLTKITFAIRIGKTTMKISRQNIAFSLLVLALLIPSALISLLSVAGAVVFHESSELLAVLNGLRAAW
jgi:Cd2+/Zn2+-exporting ATPase